MALARVKTWGIEVLTAADLNAEFNNILNNPTSLISPLTASIAGGGFQMNNIVIGAVTPLAGSFTTLTLTGQTTYNATSGVVSGLTTVASATTPDIWTSTADTISYTGTATATGFAAAPQAGATRVLVCTGAAIFTAGANLLIQGVASTANYTATAGDILTVVAITTTQFRVFIAPVTGIPGKQPTRQTFLTGSGTYTTPLGATRIVVRLVGGGGGGAGSGSSPGSGGGGGNTTFGSLTGVGGAGAIAGSGGGGGTPTGGDLNLKGSNGGDGSGTVSFPGGNGGTTALGGGAQGGAIGTGPGAASPNSGGGGGGAGSTGGAAGPGGGGGAGGYLEKVFQPPATTYAYAVGAAGTGGAAGASGVVGGPGGSGLIIVDEFYT